MATGIVIAIACIALLLLLAAKVPVALSLTGAGLLGLMLLDRGVSPSAVVESQPFVTTAQFNWIVIPMFIVMGALVTSSGLVNTLFDLANRYLKKIPGGVGVAAIAACAGFSAVSGSSVATAAAIAPIAVKEMIKAGYRPSFAAGVVASGGTLGILIPPSIVLVMYGITAGESIGSLLIAGIVPGILSTVVMAGTIMVLYVVRPSAVLAAKREPALVSSFAGSTTSEPGPTPASTILESPEVKEARSKDSNPDSRSSFGAIFRILILFSVVLGGIYFGIMTATEAAAIGAVVALLIAIVDNRKKGVRGATQAILRGVKDASSTTSMLFFIVIGSAIFTYFFIMAGAPAAVANWILSFDIPPLAVVALILLATIPLGMFLESFSMILIVVPLAYPIVVTELGFDGIWFGILMVKMIELSLITPPVGMNIFVTAGVLKGVVSTIDVFKGVMWFIVADLVLIALFLLFPDLVTFFVPSGLE